MRYQGTPRHLKNQTGRSTASLVLTIVGGIALFVVIAAIGFTITAPDDDVAMVEAAEFTPQVIAAGTIATADETVVADETVRALRDTAAVTEEELVRAAEATGSSGGVAATRTLDAENPSEDAAESSDGSGEMAPVPEEVLAADEYTYDFIDWDSIDVVDVPDQFRFDACAGAVPGLPALPWCPAGAGATIVAADDTFDGPPFDTEYSVQVYSPSSTVGSACPATSDSYAVTVRSNRPSTLSVSAWNETGGGGTTPAATYELVTEPGAAADWEAAIAADPSARPVLDHCVRLPDVSFGWVGFRVVGTSLYVPDAGATDSDDGRGLYVAQNGGRPPSGLVAATPTTLYVRAWNQSSVDEQIFVQARERSPEACDNLGDIALVGSGPGSIQGIRDRVIPMLPDRTGWPWGLSWDELEIHRLTLEPGVAYDVCIFWVRGGGPSFNPDSVVRTEHAEVVPPSPNAMSIAVTGHAFVDLEGDPLIEQVSVVAILSGPSTFDPDRPTDACRGSWSANSAAETIDIAVSGPGSGSLCTTTNTTSLILQRGMQVNVGAVDSLGDRYSRTSWIPLSSNLFRCGTDCGEQRVEVTVPMPWVAPREVTGSFDWPFDLETDAIPPSTEDAPGQDGPPVGAIVLELTFSPTGAESRNWVLGDIGEQEQSPDRLPLTPQMEVTFSNPNPGTFPRQPGIHFPDGFPGTPHAMVEVRVEADRPVTLSGSVEAYAGGRRCLRPGADPNIGARPASQLHVFRIDGLCPTKGYNLTITAADEAGTNAEIFGVGPADGSTPLPFSTAQMNVSVRGEVVIDPAAYGPGTEESAIHVSVLDLYAQHPSGRFGAAESAIAPLTGAFDEARETGWTFDIPYRQMVCADPIANGGALEPVALTVMPRSGGVVSETVSLTLQVRRWNAPIRNVSGAGGVIYRCTPPPDDSTLYSLSETVIVERLFEGVTFTSPDGLYSLTVSGFLTP